MRVISSSISIRSICASLIASFASCRRRRFSSALMTARLLQRDLRWGFPLLPICDSITIVMCPATYQRTGTTENPRFIPNYRWFMSRFMCRGCSALTATILLGATDLRPYSRAVGTLRREYPAPKSHIRLYGLLPDYGRKRLCV